MTSAKVWALDRRVFQQVMKKTGLQRIDDNLKFLRSVPLFERLTTDHMSKIADVLEVVSTIFFFLFLPHLFCYRSPWLLVCRFLDFPCGIQTSPNSRRLCLKTCTGGTIASPLACPCQKGYTMKNTFIFRPFYWNRLCVSAYLLFLPQPWHT